MSEPSLRDVQLWMKSRIQPGQDHAQSGVHEPTFRLQRGVAGEKRLAVYASGYLDRSRQGLAETYPAVEHILGRSTFARLSFEYAERHPSHDYNLSAVGRGLPDFLIAHTLTKRLPFLPDLARLEWAITQAFHAHEAPPMDKAALQAISPDQWGSMRLVFQKSVHGIVSDWPILELWKARTEARESIDIDLVNHPQRVLVRREGTRVHCEALEAESFALLEALLIGQSVSEACECLLRQNPKAELPVREWFMRWTQTGMLIGCEPAADSVSDTRVANTGV